MNFRENWTQYLIILLLAFLSVGGYANLSNLNSLDDLSNSITTLVEEISNDSSQPEENEAQATPTLAATPTLIAAPAQGNTGKDNGGEGGSPTPAPTATPTVTPSIDVSVPFVDGDIIYISHIDKKITLQIENISDKPINPTVQVLIMKRKDDSGSEILNQSYSNIAPVTPVPAVPANSTLNIEVMFDELPPSGTYEGQILITNMDENGPAPLVKKVSFDISSDQQTEFQYRLSNASDAISITIGGTQSCFSLWFWKSYDTTQKCTPQWNKYNLVLWEKNLHDQKPDVIGSELFGKENGVTGILDVSESKDKNNSFQYDLEPLNIRHPGEYEGVVRIIDPATGKNDEIKVTAQLRDALIWPFLVIFFGVLISRWVRLRALDNADQNIAFLKSKIEKLEYKLEKTNIVDYKAARDVKDDLETAKQLCALGDMDYETKYIIAKAEKDIETLVLIDIKLSGNLDENDKDAIITALKNGDLPAAKAASQKKGPDERSGARTSDWNIQIKRGYGGFIDPPLDFEVYKGDKVFFQLANGHQNQTDWFVQRQIELFGIKIKNRLMKRRQEEGRPLQTSYLLPSLGKYDLHCEYIEDPPPQIEPLSFSIVKDPLERATNRFIRTTWLISAGWAFIAAVAGILYIEANAQTFGATFGDPLDYFAALAWALGVSTVIEPTGEVIGKLLSNLGKQEKKIALPEPAMLKSKNKIELQKLFTEKKIIVSFEPKDHKDNYVFDKYVNPASLPKDGVEPGTGVVIQLKAPVTANKQGETPSENKVKLPTEEELKTLTREKILGIYADKKIGIRPTFNPADEPDFIFEKYEKPNPIPAEGVSPETKVLIGLKNTTVKKVSDSEE